jgi:hypothetical protein
MGGTVVGGSIVSKKSNSVGISYSSVDRNFVKGNIEITEFTRAAFICGLTLTHGNMLVSSGSGHIRIGGTTCAQFPCDGTNVFERGSLTIVDIIPRFRTP